MKPEEIHSELEAIFRDVVNEHVQLHPGLTADEVEGWDSVAHVNLLFAIEEAFDIQFTQREMASMGNVGDLERHVTDKLASGSR